jgi:hypothetical protein
LNSALNKWTPTPPAVTLATGRIFEFGNVASDIGGYLTVEDYTLGTEADGYVAITTGSGLTLIDSFATPVGSPNIDEIPQGLWDFNFYRYVDSTSGSTTFVFKVYKRASGGSETLLFTATSSPVTDTSVAYEIVSYNMQTATAMVSTDRIVVKVYAQTTSATTVNAHFVFDGSAHNSHFHTPIAGGAFMVGGDISGTTTNAVVGRIQTVPVDTTSPVAYAVPIYSTGTSSYNIRKLTLDDIGPAFAITSFSGGSTVEVGATVTNPAFTASYASAAASATITNTDSIGSPLTLTTPFTSGTVTGSFSHSTASSVTFTLTAIAATTKTATQSITFLARSFGGIGGAGAVSATASGSTAVLDSSLGTLSDKGLHSSDVGQSYGPFSPTVQKIYLLLPHTATAHTFKDQSGFAFPMNAPTTFTFTNQNSAALSYDLYESTNSLSTPFTITVVS